MPLTALVAVVVLAMSVLWCLAPGVAFGAFVSSGAFSGPGAGDGQLNTPGRAAVEQATGNLFVVDSGNNRVQVFKPDGSGSASYLTQFGTGVLGGPGTLSAPWGIAIAESGGQTSVYVMDAGNNRIVKFDSDEAAVPTFTVDPTFSSPAQGAGGDQVQNFRSAIAVAPNGDLWVADSGAQLLKRFTAAGAHVAGSNFDGVSSGTAFTGLLDVAVNAAGDLYVIDATGDIANGIGTSRVERFAADGAHQATLTPVGPNQRPATVAVDRSSGDVVVSGEQDAVYRDELPTLHVFDATNVPQPAPVLTVLYNAVSGLAVASGTQARLYVVQDFGYWNGFPYGTPGVQVFTEVPPPAISTPTVSNLQIRGADVSGTVNPNGQSGTWTVEYSADEGATWTSVFGGFLAAGSTPVAVSKTLTGLEPHTSYRVRISASNPAAASSAEVTFTTLLPDAPVVGNATSSSGSPKSATLRGTVNPQSVPVTYIFEYGLTTAYGSRIPLQSGAPAGSGNAPVGVEQTIGALEPDTTYHYRLVASNGYGGRTEGPDRTIKTKPVRTAAVADTCPNAAVRAQQGSTFLPDCRAYELVTPADKQGVAAVGLEYNAYVTRDGLGANYMSYDAFADAVGGGAQTYWSMRGSTGWSTRALTPPLDPDVAANTSSPPLRILSSDDGSRTILMQRVHRVSPEAPAGRYRALFVREPDRSLTWLTRPAVTDPQEAAEYFVAGGSADLRRIVFRANPANLATGTVKIVDRDAARVRGSGLYESVDGQLDAVGILPDGSVPADGAVSPGRVGARGESPWPSQANNQVSRNGRRIVFMTPTPDIGSTAIPQLYMRIDGERTALITKSMITGLPAAGLSGGLKFGYASPDGTKVWFKTSERLTLNAPATGEKWYRSDVDSETVTYEPELSTSAFTMPLVSSKDGSRILYVKAGTQDLWLRDGTADREVAASVDISLHGLTDSRTVRGTADGSYFVFISRGEVSPGSFNNDDGFKHVYLYDVAAEKLSCVSCPPDGISATGNSDIHWDNSELQETQAVTDDGRVFFHTPAALVGRDVNGVEDVYQWAHGDVSILSGGTGRFPSFLHDVSADGGTVLFQTANMLDPLAGGGKDLYVARVEGGFLRQTDPQPCNLDCQGPPTPPPTLPTIGSITFGGDGNVPLVPDPVKVSVGVSKLKPVSGSAASLKVRVAEAGRVSVAGSSIKRSGVSASKAGTYKVKIALSSKAKKTLKKKKTLKVSARVSFKAKSGQSASKTISVTFKQPKAKRAPAKKGGR